MERTRATEAWESPEAREDSGIGLHDVESQYPRCNEVASLGSSSRLRR